MPSIPLRYDTGDTHLHEMTNAEMQYAAHQILVEFASSNTGSGTVNINSGGTVIGTFVDTSRPYTIGSHPIGTTINSSSTTIHQDYTTATESLERPVEFSTNHLRRQADTPLNNTLIEVALDMLVNDGLGSYRIQPTSPTITGTWVSIGTITDTAAGGNTTTTLWRKTTDTAPTVERTMKARVDGNLQEMTDAEIKTLTARMRNRISATGKGKYAIQQNAPVGGTWVRKGNAFTDTRQSIGNVAYSGTYSGSYVRYVPLYYGGILYGSFTGYYTGFYTGFYTGLTMFATKETPSTYSLWIRTA